MKRLLQINSSAFSNDGESSKLANAFVEQWLSTEPESDIIKRDLGMEPIPHQDVGYLAAIQTPAEQRTAEQQVMVKFANQLIDEVKRSDVIVLGVPMYNFGVPSTLKAWFDHIARAGETFSYTENGPLGLLKGKQVIVMAARGGHYKDTSADMQSDFVRQFFNFLGIEDVQFVYAEGLNIDDETREEAIAKAQHQIAGLLAA